MYKEELMPRCPYCDDEMKYVLLDMERRTARLRCPTCDSEFPPREEESDDDDYAAKPRSDVCRSNHAEPKDGACLGGTALQYSNLRVFPRAHKQNVPSDSVQSWYWQLRRRRRGLRHKVAVLGKEPTREGTKREPWSEP